jgi:hypothetical protein
LFTAFIWICWPCSFFFTTNRNRYNGASAFDLAL